MQSNSNSELGTEPVGRLLLRLAMPAICAQLVNMLYNIVDRIFIGHIPDVGADALTGVGVTFPVIMLISAFSALVGMGGAPRASIALGEKETGAGREYPRKLFCCADRNFCSFDGVFFDFSAPSAFAIRCRSGYDRLCD